MAQERANERTCGSATIVGAGIAGMTAALRLLEAGFDVTVFEKTETVGGKFGAINVGGTLHEHAYHFLADWCLNFWDIVRRIDLSKDDHFVRRDAIKFLRRTPENRRANGQYNFVELKHGGSVLNFWDNVHSGIIPADDMIAYAYSLLDLVTEGGGDDDPDELEFLNRISVNGFMRSRTYMTDLAALLHQEALLKAFAVPSYETSVRSYRTFVRYFGRDAGGWILKGDCQTAFWDHFLKKLRSYNGRNGGPRFHLRCHTSVEDIEVARDGLDGRRLRVSGVRLRGLGEEPSSPVDHLILAVPYVEVARLVERSELLRECLPDLLELRKLKSRQMASLDLYFKQPLPGIPAEHVTLIDDRAFARNGRPERRARRADRARAGEERWIALADDGDIASKYGLSFVDNYQAWKETTPPEETWLNVVAADFEELAGLPKEAACDAIIRELHGYLDFKDKDIDPERSHLRLNDDTPLFANSVGSWQFRPETRTHHPEYRKRLVPNRVAGLYLAGDYCRSKIDLVCLEGAVTTGIAAARAVAEQGGVPERIDNPLVPPEVSQQECEQAKIALAPWLALAVKGRTRARR
jgi:hypothetical protein